jgi:hypothetical protein
MPGTGMLVAGAALLGIMGEYVTVRSEKKSNILATIIELVLGFGAISLLIGVIQWGYETFYSVRNPEAGHSEPCGVLFRVSYGCLSVAAFVAFNKWIRKATLEPRLPSSPAPK